jgi:hypothetical protein
LEGKVMLRLTILAVLSLAACGGAPTDPNACDTNPGFSGAPFMTGIKSTSGNLSLTIKSSPTSPPQRGNGSLEYLITDSSGNPVDGLTVSVLPWMVQMGHGSSITPCVMSEGNGVYVVNNVYLFMAGEWQLRTTVSGPTTDSFSPTVQVD